MRWNSRPWTITGAALFLALAVALTLPSLTSCEAVMLSDGGEHTTEAESQALSTEAAAALAEHYRALMTELEKDLLSLKEQQYIDRLAYEARISELESLLDLATKAPTENQTNGRDPLESRPEDDTESIPTGGEVMAFRYAMEDGHAVIYEYLGDETHVTVPGAIEGYPVTHIADEAFAGTAVESVVIPYGVQKIGWFAFSGCTKLRSIRLPPSLESVGYGAFDGVTDAVFIVQAGSYGEAFARSFGFCTEVE